VNKEGVVTNVIDNDLPNRLFLQDGKTMTEIFLNDDEMDDSMLIGSFVGQKLVYFANSENLTWFLNESGIPPGATWICSTPGWVAASLPGGDLDFAATYLWGNLGSYGEWIMTVEDADATSALVVFGDQAFNIMDAGNYMWGAAGAQFGYSKGFILGAANQYAIGLTVKMIPLLIKELFQPAMTMESPWKRLQKELSPIG